jgi:hypothetical protein
VSQDKVEISKINLIIEGQSISVTPEGAKKLRAILNDLFGKDVQVIEKHHVYPFYWQYNYIPRHWDNNTVYYQDTSAKTPIASFEVINHALEFKIQ